MAKVILGATISLDGFINDRHGSVEYLYPDLADWRESELGRESIQNTGAVVMGWNTYSMADDPDWYTEDYEYQVPIFVLTHHPPKKRPKTTGALTFTFVMDGFESAIRQAEAAAGDREVNIIGAANTARQCLNAGLADELHVDIMPVLLCGGLRLFENIRTEKIQLERIKTLELPGGRTHLRFRFIR